MALKGVNIGGAVHQFDYNYLANKPASLPVVTVSDFGKFLQVDSSGQWAAVEVPSAEEARF